MPLCVQGKQSELERMQQQLQEATSSRADLIAQLQRADTAAAEKLQVALAPCKQHFSLNLLDDSHMFVLM